MGDPVIELLDAFRGALAAGRAEEARALAQRIAGGARGRRDEPGIWAEVGHLYAEHWRYEDADRALAHASALDPGSPATESIRAFVKQELGDIDAARQALELASARVPDDLRIAIGSALLLPQVYASEADVAQWRRRYAEGLAALVAGADRFAPEQVFELDRGNFLLAYQGEDDRPLQEGYSSLLARLAERTEPRWRERRRPSFDGGRRLRVGFAGSIFRDCTAGRYFERWITGLDPRRFERFVYHTGPVSDAFTARLAGAVEHFVALRAPPRDTAARLYGDRLDLLVYPEVGMDALTYLLAALRLAPVQVAGWGHPVTTGSDAIDAFLTCAEMEPPDAAAHYTERLEALPGLGVDYPMPQPPPAADRAAFGLPAGKRLYVCAQSLFKIHPAMDVVLADILAADADGVLVLFQATSRAVTLQLGLRVQEALARRGVPPRGQVKFLPRLDAVSFRKVLAMSDVVLDTVRWSGGNTSLDAFASGAPVVALPGRFMRGRQTAAMLRMMGLPELVADTEAAYARLAVQVARDRSLNAALRERIVAARPALFDRPEPVAALAETLLRLAAASP